MAKPKAEHQLKLNHLLLGSRRGSSNVYEVNPWQFCLESPHLGQLSVSATAQERSELERLPDAWLGFFFSK